jgi:hypothetical protein
MSKKIVVELTAEEIQNILCVCTDSVAKRLREARDSKKHFSVLEWHPVSETPKRNRIIVRLKNGVSSIGYPYSYTYYEDEKAEGHEEWDLYNYRIEDVVEWAYLPK